MRTAPFEAEHMTAPDQVAAPPFFPCTNAVVHSWPAVMRTAPFEAEHMTAPDQVAAPPFFPCTNAVVHTCPRCAGSQYCEIRGRQLLQCRQCRHQTSLIAGTVLQGTKLPMRVWFRAM